MESTIRRQTLIYSKTREEVADMN